MKQGRPTSRRVRGFSLIELLVSMLLGLVLVLAVTSVLVKSEGSKRTTTNSNDMNQTGAYLAYLLDRSLRSAGSGYVQRWDNAVGCALNVSRSGSVILPRTAAWPAPFTAVPPTLRLAPVVIGKGQSSGGSDVLMVMTGTAGFGELAPQVVPASVITSPTQRLRVANTLNAKGDDLVLLADVKAGMAGCLLEQVTSGFVGAGDQDELLLSGTYYAAAGSGVSLTGFGSSTTTYAITLGNAVSNPPQFQLFGVGDNATLYTKDMLQLDGTDAPVPISDGVVQLRALYGVDTDGDGKQDAFVDPSGTEFDSRVLLAGTPAAQASLRKIVSVRIALVLRSPLLEKTIVTPTTLTLFADQPSALQLPVPVSGDDRYRRFRIVEFTVPLRNVLL